MNRLLDVLTERRTIRTFLAVNDANFPPGDDPGRGEGLGRRIRGPQGSEGGAESRADGKDQPITLIFGKSEGDSMLRPPRDAGRREGRLHPARPNPRSALAGEPDFAGGGRQEVAARSSQRTLRSFSPEVANKITVTGTANYELSIRDEGKELSTAARALDVAAPPTRRGRSPTRPTVAEMLRILGTTTLRHPVRQRGAR